MADKNPITPEMIERVARALCRADGNPRDIRIGGPLGDKTETQIDKIWFAWLRPAYAAIVATREPTVAMSKAGDLAARGQGAHDCEVPMSDVWRAMVDAALRE